MLYNNVNLKDIKIGGRVKVELDGKIVTGTVTDKSTDIKNGVAGIDYELDNGDEHWAYIHQVQRVLS